MSPGEQLTITITDLAFGGEGVARHNDFVVFVPFVALGEKVVVEVTEVRKHFARARLLRVAEASPDRVEPKCRYFGECGGCQYQHLAYPAQLAAKHKQVQELLRRIGGVDPGVVTTVVPCPTPYHYRNRIMIRSQWDKFKQGLNIGFIRAENRLVVDIESCLIAEEAINEQLREVRKNPPPKGGLKVVLRVAPEGWFVPRDSFFQNNFHLLPALVELVRERLQAAGSRHLVDLYCGVGFFSLELAGSVEGFVGVELDRMAIQAALKNAEAKGIVNGEFVAASTEEVIGPVLNRFPRDQTTVILDPPRTGCPGSALETLRAHPPTQVIYVSCHPATMARDLNILTRDGVFGVAQVTPLDMFPQTSHVECVADIRRLAGPTPAP